MRLPSIVFSTAACCWAALAPALAEERPGDPASVERYREVLERPLFSPARRAPAQAEEAAIEPADIPVLQGVVLARDKRIAVLAYGTPSKAQRVREGQDVGPWKVEEITKDRVILRASDGKAATVRLKTTGLHQAATSVSSR